MYKKTPKHLAEKKLIPKNLYDLNKLGFCGTLDFRLVMLILWLTCTDMLFYTGLYVNLTRTDSTRDIVNFEKILKQWSLKSQINTDAKHNWYKKFWNRKTFSNCWIPTHLIYTTLYLQTNHSSANQLADFLPPPIELQSLWVEHDLVLRPYNYYQLSHIHLSPIRPIMMDRAPGERIKLWNASHKELYQIIFATSSKWILQISTAAARWKCKELLKALWI